ncbi:PfkB family carbohydrate kinase [Geminicoccus flavidas]|uniref:PfkB family carbohydrate kinase n=1 Tax=Geminicoccus flavidas TaxID=2506407 RepID=UPI0013581DC9|nr:PfkB family carbohydrate kinase [Geminicoccus flavidas]
MSNAEKPVIVVVGSLHYDIMVDAPDRPRKGETVTGHGWRPKFGGKGGNQAVAAAQAGARVRMAGAVGDDEFGRFLLEALQAGGVEAAHVRKLAGIGSGMSVAISDAGGDYGAVIVSGANLHLDPAHLEEADLWRDVRALILQNEIPDRLNLAAAGAAHRVGATVCLNAAPFRPLSDELVALVDLLVVNALEAEALSAVPVTDLASATKAAQALAARFPIAIVTAGDAGVAAMAPGQPPVALEALPVELVSTHGAGDAFMGTLVAALAAGGSFAQSLAQANRMAAAHVSRRPEPL